MLVMDVHKFLVLSLLAAGSIAVALPQVGGAVNPSAVVVPGGFAVSTNIGIGANAQATGAPNAAANVGQVGVNIHVMQIDVRITSIRPGAFEMEYLVLGDPSFSLARIIDK